MASFYPLPGSEPEITVTNDLDRGIARVEIADATVASRWANRSFSVDRNGVETIQLEQIGGRRSSVRITLLGIDRTWSARYSDLGGIVLLPGRGASPPDRSDRPTARGDRVIESLEVTADGEAALHSSRWRDRLRNAGLGRGKLPTIALTFQTLALRPPSARFRVVPAPTFCGSGSGRSAIAPSS